MLFLGFISGNKKYISREMDQSFKNSSFTYKKPALISEAQPRSQASQEETIINWGSMSGCQQEVKGQHIHAIVREERAGHLPDAFFERFEPLLPLSLGIRASGGEVVVP